MKVTLIAPLPPIKAISPYCIHLARALSKNVNLEVISFRRIIPEGFYSGGTLEKGVKFKDIENAEVKNILTWYNPLSYITAGLKSKGDIIHIQHWELYSSLVYMIILPLIKLRSKKIVITIHNITPHIEGKLINIIYKLINKFIFSFANGIIVHNKRNKEKLIQLFNIDEKKIYIIGHGVLKPETKTKNISKKHAQELLNIPLNKKILLFFGYIWDYKGLDILLRSLNIIKSQVPNIVLCIAGQPLKFRKAWNKYQKIIDDYNLHDYVIKKLEYIPDSKVELYFSASDLVVLPYKKPFDTHGGVAALSLYFKKPLVVTDIGGLPEFIKDKRALCFTDDVEDLAKKIINILKSKYLLFKLSKDSEELNKELTWELIATKTTDIYNKVANNVLSS